MEVKLQAEAGEMPENVYLSVRVGEVRKLAKYNPSNAITFPEWKFNGKVDIYKRVGQCDLFFQRDSDDGKMAEITTDDPSMTGLRLKCWANEVGKNKVETDLKAKTTNVDSSMNYLEEHKVNTLLQNAIRALLKEKPASAQDFLHNYFARPKEGPLFKPETSKVEPEVVPEKIEVNYEVAVSAPIEQLDSCLINLDRRPDRLRECGARLAASVPGLRWRRLPAVDGKVEPIDVSMASTSWHTGRNTEYQIIRSQRKGWDDLDSYQVKTLNMSPGERGCAMSHIKAWQLCATHTDGKPLLVMEDDAVPRADFTSLFKQCMETLPADADILYLGYSQAAEWVREVGPVLVEAEYVWTTVAYMIWPECAQALLRRLPVDQPVDNFLACLAADGAIKSYCARPKLVFQAGQWNADSDIGHSDECYWGSDSNIVHSDHLYWGSHAPEALAYGAVNAAAVAD